MKKYVFLFLALCLVIPASAQTILNPKIGFCLINLSDPPSGVDYSGDFGFQMGMDARFGNRLFFQPGVHYMQMASVIKTKNNSNVQVEEDITRNYIKMKTLLGFNLLDEEKFKFRLTGGPTMDVLLSVDSNDETGSTNKDDFKSTAFNLEAGLGVDIWFITVDIGYTYGLSKVYKDNFDAKNLGLFASAGIVFKLGGE